MLRQHRDLPHNCEDHSPAEARVEKVIKSAHTGAERIHDIHYDSNGDLVGFTISKLTEAEDIEDVYDAKLTLLEIGKEFPPVFGDKWISPLATIRNPH